MTSASADIVRVLMIDDDEEDVFFIRAMFREVVDFQSTVDWEPTFQRGLERQRRERHDIYLVDYRIGAETGIDWMREARRSGLTTAPVILLTGQGNHQIDIEAMEAGAADYLVKGRLDAEQLSRSVRYALDRARYLATIAEKEIRYRQLFEHVPLPMWAFDRDTFRFVAVNDAAIRHYGYSRDEFLAMTILDIRPKTANEDLRRTVSERRGGLRSVSIWEHIRKDGSVIEVDITSHEVEIADRPCILVLARDVTDQRRTEARVRLLARAFESSTSGMAILDAKAIDRPVIYVNSALLRMTGYAHHEVVGRNSAFLIDQESASEDIQEFRSAMSHRAHYEAVLRCRRKDGSIFSAQITLAPVLDGEELTHFVAVATDLTEQRRQEAEITYLARHDPVTGLLRFSGAEDAIQPMIDAEKTSEKRVAVLHVDIDRFRAVNDTLGYRGGDETLHILGQRLRYIAGDHGKLWRAGGDEFIMAVPYSADEEDPFKIAETVREWMEMPVELPSGKLQLSACVGVAIYPLHAGNAVDIVQCMDAALRRAKHHGRNAAVSFADGYMDEVHERISLHRRLRDAVAGNEFVLHYQPLVGGRDGRIVGMEALLRWETPDRGMIPPSRFIPLAEDLGVIVELGRWVLREACLQGRRWLDMGFADIRIAVNVSAIQLLRMSFLDDVCEALDSADIPASMLEVELTETAIMENLDRAHDNLHGLHDLGVSIALDDFGIGHSSLSQLRHLPIDKLKIDRSFVEGISKDSGGGAIARAIIAMGHELHMKVLAEGIEQDAQFGFLAKNHCDEFQGYLFSRPLPAAEATAFLRRRYVEMSLFDRVRPSRSILLVDDEENVLSALTRTLRRDGYTIHTAKSAAEGLDILALHRIQVIVSDQRMPEMSGVEFLSRVKEMYPDTVRIILSGYTDLSTVTDAINRGAIYKFLTKPWNDEELREQVLEAFRRQATTSPAMASG